MHMRPAESELRVLLEGAACDNCILPAWRLPRHRRRERPARVESLAGGVAALSHTALEAFEAKRFGD